MNFPMFQDLALYFINGQYLVQGRRAAMNAGHVPMLYPAETFLITGDKKRADLKFRLLQNCTAKI